MPVFRSYRFRPGRHCARTPGGFTLIELAVTLAVLAIFIAISAPLFTGVINGNRLTSNANELVAAIQIARSESIRNNTRAVVCESANGTSCSNNSPWRGWIVFVDRNGNTVPDANEIMRVGNIEQPTQVLASSNITNSRIVFRADGMAYGNAGLLQGVLRVCLPITNPPINVRDVSLSAGGRVAIKTATAGTGGTCPAPGNT